MPLIPGSEDDDVSTSHEERAVAEIKTGELLVMIRESSGAMMRLTSAIETDRVERQHTRAEDLENARDHSRRLEGVEDSVSSLVKLQTLAEERAAREEERSIVEAERKARREEERHEERRRAARAIWSKVAVPLGLMATALAVWFSGLLGTDQSTISVQPMPQQQQYQQAAPPRYERAADRYHGPPHDPRTREQPPSTWPVRAIHGARKGLSDVIDSPPHEPRAPEKQ
jgi:hypothetical protein